MNKIKSNKQDVDLVIVQKSVKAFAKQATEPDVTVDISKCNYRALLKDINEEKRLGATGTIVEFLQDFNDTVGLDCYGIKFIEVD